MGEVEVDMSPFIGKTHNDLGYTNIKFIKCDFPNATLSIDLRISDSNSGMSPEVQEERLSPLNFKQMTVELETEIASLHK